MKSILITLPCSLVVSLLVADATLTILGIPLAVELQLGAVAITTVLLYERGLADLGVIGAISLFAQANAQGPGGQVVAPHLLIGLMFAIIIAPPMIRAMGLEFERPRIG